MSTTQVSALLALLILTGPTYIRAAEGARMKCWVNHEGIRECGNRVPPEYIQQGYQELDKEGIVREEMEPAKTAEELAEARRLAALKAAKQKQEAAIRTKNRVLLQTFSSVSDIERARDDRITALEAIIKLTRVRIEKIELNLNEHIKRAADSQRLGKAPAPALLDDIESLERQIGDNNRFIDQKRAEQEQIRQDHAADIERYKRLKGIE